jgi:hypothetical protein
LEQTLIVFGTKEEMPTNREAALEVQKGIIERGSNITVTVKSDSDVTDDELKNHHVLLIGRPETNSVMARFRGAFPVTFGTQSFTVRGETYAHANSAVLAAAENPLNKRFSMVTLVGLSAASTLKTASQLARGGGNGEVVVYPSASAARSLVIPVQKATSTGS